MPLADLPRKKPPGRYHHGDLRPELLRASRAIIERAGVAALTFRQVARAVGVSHAAPAHHFDDKNQLLACVAAQGFDELTQAMTRAAGCAAADPVRRLNATGVAYITFAAEHPNLFRLMFGRELTHCSEPAFVESAERAYGVLKAAARDVTLSHAAASSAALEVVIAGAWSLVHGMSMLWLDGRLAPGDKSPEALAALAREVTELVGRSLQTPKR